MTHPKRPRRAARLVLGAVVAPLLAACGQAQPGARIPPAPRASVPAPSAPGPSQSASAPAPALTIRISLDRTRVIAGRPIHGVAVVTDTTAKPILAPGCSRTGWLVVGLTNAKIPFDPAFADLACAPSVRLAPGTNRFPVTVRTTYPACLQPGGQSLIPMPACTRSGPPPLPAGAYTTKVVTEGPLPAGTPPAPPVSVTLLPPR